MLPFLRKLFSVKTVNAKKFLSIVKEMTVLDKEINSKQTQLEEIEFSLITAQKEDVYISLADFLGLINSNELSIKAIISKCKHISELNSLSFSTVDVYPIIENDHIVLCPDVKECKQHKDFKGEKIKIISIRRS